MHVVIMGAGVVGVAVAYKLLSEGHEVTVVDRMAEPAMFTSFANAGLVAPGHAYAWSSPRAPGMMWRSLYRGDQAIRFRPSLDPALWRWAWKFLKECKPVRTNLNTERKARLCVYSQAKLNEVVAEAGVEYDGNTGGLLYFFRTPESFEAGAQKSEMLRRNGIEIEILDRDALIAKDPALEPAREHIAGGLYAVTDESGDAHLFTQALARKCEELGATLRMNTEIKGLVANGQRIEAVETSGERVGGDAFVLALGIYSPHLLRQLGMDLPIYPIKGYSATLQIAEGHEGPVIGGVDEDNLLAYCPMGRRLRVTATAEFAGYDNSYRPKDFRGMLARTKDLFPTAVDYSEPALWAGLRPMTPTGLPIIDRSPYENLFLNTGHGHMGWTMSCGSAAILADLVMQRTPDLDLAGMRYEDVH
ncbi:MAG: D-amino acid dehydrogenase [Alphaproteobacteria bacterium]|jgi:D-amino-acid dehydrogenase|nr:D-amino acid dehydrogenase [Alphaproteobacteria bacterium]